VQGIDQVVKVSWHRCRRHFKDQILPCPHEIIPDLLRGGGMRKPGSVFRQGFLGYFQNGYSLKQQLLLNEDADNPFLALESGGSRSQDKVQQPESSLPAY
jgi:hypothetical protein